jgi:pyruvate ferredoxin oxidoreductase gamma subunit
MIQVRFHGRGGHGIKTASRILGTAAFLHGYEAQDFPIYGAERRGAPIVAFTRIADRPILMRGPITEPDCVIIADETLLADVPGGPLAGVTHNTVVFVNTDLSPEALRERIAIPGGLITLDVTRRVEEALGSPRSLSGALGGVACRMVATIDLHQMNQAVRQELGALDLPEAAVEKNAALAEACFHALPMPVWDRDGTAPKPASGTRPIALTFHPAAVSAPSILTHANTRLRHTGDWRFFRPEIDRERCNRCGICVLRCPDGVIALDKDGYPVIDYEECKGCLICASECPLHVITSEKEAHHASDAHG